MVKIWSEWQEIGGISFFVMFMQNGNDVPRNLALSIECFDDVFDVPRTLTQSIEILYGCCYPEIHDSLGKAKYELSKLDKKRQALLARIKFLEK